MMHQPASFLTPWSNFYVMIGSSAAALTGLVFVVITLVTRSGRARTREGISTFTTPTVVHFCATLLVAAIAIVPWHTLTYPAAIIGLAGVCGIIYVGRLILRSLRLNTYQPDLEDWMCYSLLPMLAYGAMLVAAVALLLAPSPALFVLAGSVLLLIFIGIHNAWDIVTYITISLTNDPP
jgi:F0F1-type ATP synthase assembly protein I